MDLLDKLGINPILLITQIINFLILLFVLKKFLYKPILEMLEKRRNKIEDSLKKSEEITKKYQEVENFQKEELHKIQARSQEMLTQVKDRAEKMKAEIVKKSEDEAAEILEKTKREIQSEKEKMLVEARKEISDVAVAAVGKVLENQLDAKSQGKITERAIEEVGKVYKS